jgi:hypothetical protein
MRRASAQQKGLTMHISTAEVLALRQENAELQTRLAAVIAMRERMEQALRWIERLLQNQFLDPAQKVYLLALRFLQDQPAQRRDQDGYVETTHDWLEKRSGIAKSTQARIQQQLKDAGALQVRHAYDPVHIRTHSSFRLAPAVLQYPERIQNAPTKKQRGGRRPRCRDCHSDNVIIRQRVDILQTITCRECGSIYAEQLPTSERVVFDSLVDTLQSVPAVEV